MLVGETNPYGADPEYALSPWPRRASGNRLREILGLLDLDYIAKYERVNLCTGKWSMPAARAKAAQIVIEGNPRYLVLLGAKVCKAFCVPYEPFTMCPSGLGYPLVVLPHPSGLNRIWNDLDAIERAREAIREAEELIG